MKRQGVVILALALVFASGCSGVVKKKFKVFADPPDAVIRVVSGVELKELKYRSPATIIAEAPKDPELAAKAVLEVSRDNYKPTVIRLSDINEGDTLNLKLERILRDIVRYRLSYRLVRPAVSPELRFRDTTIAISFAIAEQSFQMRLENVSDYQVKILWDRAQYTDVNKHTHRILYDGVPFQDRNSPIPDQILQPHESVQEAVIPVSNIYMSQQKKGYDIRPLFQLESEFAAGLKGNSIILFIPVEVDRQIIPYNFKIEITDAVKEIVKG